MSPFSLLPSHPWPPKLIASPVEKQLCRGGVDQAQQATLTLQNMLPDRKTAENETIHNSKTPEGSVSAQQATARPDRMSAYALAELFQHTMGIELSLCNATFVFHSSRNACKALMHIVKILITRVNEF